MFRFSIRDLLWLMVVVAICCTWFIHTKRLSSRIAAREREAKLNWFLYEGQMREVEMAKLAGRQAEVVGMPDMEGTREQARLDAEAQKTVSNGSN